MKTRIRSLLPAMAALIALGHVQPARSDRLYSFRPLPHLGYGGVALGTAQGQNLTDILVSGYTYDAAGNLVAAFWGQDDAGHPSLTTLPGIGGQNAVAYRPVCGVDGVTYATGAAHNAAGVWKPVLWRETADVPGVMEANVLPTVGGQGGAARDARQCMYPICGGVWVVGDSETQSGRMRATFWHENASGRVEPRDLGTLGGTESHAYALNAHVGMLQVVGSAADSSGRMRACIWTSKDGGATWTIREAHPKGAAASALFGSSGLDWFVIGTAMSRNGRSLGYMMTDASGTANPGVLPALGFRNSLARGVTPIGDGHQIIGSVWDDLDLMHAVIWRHTAGAGITQAYPLAARVDHPLADDMAFRAESIGPYAVVGSYTPPGGVETPMAVIDNAEGDVIGHIRGIVGKAERGYGDADLFRAGDGRSIHVDTSVIELSFHEDENRDGDFDDRGEMKVTTRARVVGGAIDGHNGAPGGVLDVDAFCFKDGVWQTIGTHALDTGFTISDDLLHAGLAFRSESGEIRVRLRVRPLSKRVKGFEVDQVTVRRR